MKHRQTLLLIIAVIALHQTGGAQSRTPPSSATALQTTSFGIER